MSAAAAPAAANRERTCVGVVFGGPSAEHEVSAASALAVIRGLRATRFRPVAIGIGRDGRWRLLPARAVGEAETARAGGRGHSGPAIRDRLTADGVQVELRHGGRLVCSGSPEAVIERLDVVFPVMHGPYGEDGVIQGYLEALDVPYVGSGVTASAVHGTAPGTAGSGLTVTGPVVIDSREVTYGRTPSTSRPCWRHWTTGSWPARRSTATRRRHSTPLTPTTGRWPRTRRYWRRRTSPSPRRKQEGRASKRSWKISRRSRTASRATFSSSAELYLTTPEKRGLESVTSTAPEPSGPYSPAIVSGRHVFCSGTLGIDPATGKAPESARDLLWEELRLAVEPAAAVPFAAWLVGRVPGHHPCLVICGANADWHPA